LENIFLEWTPKRIEPDTLPLIPNVSQAEVDRVMDASIRTVITQDGWKLCWSDKDKYKLFKSINIKYLLSVLCGYLLHYQ
jgi:hypothetical protein